MRRDLLREIDKDIPRVGDRRQESFYTRTTHGVYELSPPEPCTVIYVNLEHRWYSVYFERLGFACGYKFDDARRDQRTDQSPQTPDTCT